MGSPLRLAWRVFLPAAARDPPSDWHSGGHRAARLSMVLARDARGFAAMVLGTRLAWGGGRTQSRTADRIAAPLHAARDCDRDCVGRALLLFRAAPLDALGRCVHAARRTGAQPGRASLKYRRARPPAAASAQVPRLWGTS